MEGRRNLVLFSVLIGTLMSAIDTTIVILALPTITSYFKADLFTSIWIIIIYLLIVAVLTTQLGGLGDIFGRGKIFNAGFLIFIAGSAASGFSPGIIYLIAFRGVQAVGAALMQANSNAIIADYFGPQERGKAFGYTSMGWSIGGTLGIVLGGIITTFLGWQYIFFINIPIGLFGFILGIRYIRDNNKREAKIDFVGMGLLTAILSFISYGATDVAGRGVDSFNMLLISFGILLLVPFIIYERYPEDPVIKLDAFKVHSLSLSLTASLMQALGYLSVIFLLIMYLQGIRGYNPLEASLLLVPGYIISSLISPKMGKLSDRIGAPIVASVGIFFMAVAVLIYLELQVNTAIIVLIIASIISGIGGAMFWPSNSSAVMSSAPKRLYGSISGLLRTLSSVGTLLSYVISITIASISVPRYVAFEVFLGESSLTGGVSRQFLAGIHSALWLCLGFLILAGITSFIRGSGMKGGTELDTPISS